MGLQTARRLRGIPAERELVYGEIDGGSENEEQADVHHADPDQHV